MSHNSVAVRRERHDRRCTFEAVGSNFRAEILPARRARWLSAGRELVAPCKLRAVKPAARGEFPFGLRRQFLTHPFCVSGRIHMCDMHDRVVVQSVDIAFRSGKGGANRRFSETATILPNCADRRAAMAA